MTDHLSTRMFDRPAVTIANLKPAWTVDDTEMHRMLSTERDGMRGMLERVAVHRETDPDAATDPRLAEATRSIRYLAATMADVPDDLLLYIAAINRITGGLMSALIAARLCGINFDTEPYVDATAFYRSLTAIADETAVRVRRNRLN
jgi:hypothetical protein